MRSYYNSLIIGFAVLCGIFVSCSRTLDDNMPPDFHIELKNELSHLNEIISYTFKYRNLVITNHKNILPHLAIIKKGGTCGIDFFYQVLQYLENAKILKDEVIKAAINEQHCYKLIYVAEGENIFKGNYSETEEYYLYKLEEK